ncbi:MAG: rhomboid family intramembrane serine protease [Lachnospiraceae bacterium]|nr:rhomboid family intramembrane serine protease [Lachnospiraceae bacterium]
MIVDLVGKQLQNDGFEAVYTDFKGIVCYIRQEEQYANIIRIIDRDKTGPMDRDMYEAQKKALTESIAIPSFHLITWIFCEDIHEAYLVAGDDYMCWAIDRNTYRLCIDEKRVEDFYGYKGRLEAFLEKSEKLINSGNVKEIGDMMYSDAEKKKMEKVKRKKPAPVTICLIAINLIVFITYLAIKDPFIISYQMNKVYVEHGEYYRLFTAMFLHAGVMHLFSNMILLYVLGEALEPLTGSIKFGIIYIISGILGNLASYGYEVMSGKVYTSIGASGAVYGCLGLFVYLALRRYKGLNVPIGRIIFMLIYCIYSSFAEAHVDYAAHIGGLVAGFLLAVMLCSSEGGRKDES